MAKSFKKTVFIVNPASGSGRAGGEWSRLRGLAERKLGSFTAMATSKAGDAAEFARRAADGGADRLVCFGGDGLLNEAINGLMRVGPDAAKNTAVGFVPAGTGVDFSRTAPVPRNPKDALEVVAEGFATTIDLGKIAYRDHNGKSSFRYFHNVASFGVGGEIDLKVNKSSKLFGPLSFWVETFAAVLKYGKKRIFINVDDRLEGFAKVWNVAICNGRTHGGGMKVAKDARIDDGLFHVTFLGDLTLPQVFREFPRLYTGNLDGPKTHTVTGRKIWAASDEKVLIDVDGECPGMLPVFAEIVPAALTLIVESR